MIDKRIYDLDYVRELQARYKTDPGLLERVLYAFGLLEALGGNEVHIQGRLQYDAAIGSSGSPFH